MGKEQERMGMEQRRQGKEQERQGRLLGSLVEGSMSGLLQSKLGENTGSPTTLKDVKAVASAVLARPNLVDQAADLVVDFLLDKDQGFRAVLTAEAQELATLLKGLVKVNPESDRPTVEDAQKRLSAAASALDLVPQDVDLPSQQVEKALEALQSAKAEYDKLKTSNKAVAASDGTESSVDGTESDATVRAASPILGLLCQYWSGNESKRRELLRGRLCLPALTSLQPKTEGTGRSRAFEELEVDRLAPARVWHDCTGLTLVEIKATSQGLPTARAQLQRTSTVLACVYSVIRKGLTQGSSDGLQLPERLQVHAFIAIGQDGDERADQQRLPSFMPLRPAHGPPVDMDVKYLVARGGALQDWEPRQH